MIDLHTHILPFLDDGAKNYEEALAMLCCAEEDGIDIVAGTPHFVPGKYAPSAEKVKLVCGELNEKAVEAGIKTKVIPGHEVRAGAGILNKLRNGEILTYDKCSKYILLELPYTSIPEWMDKMMFELGIADITPIIAHPERNSGFHKTPERLFELVQKGCLAQLTAGSLLGYFGEDVKELSEKLLRHKLIHLIASDAHDSVERLPKLRDAYEKVGKLESDSRADMLFNKIPEMIINGEEIMAEEPIAFEEIERPKSFFERLFG